MRIAEIQTQGKTDWQEIKEVKHHRMMLDVEHIWGKITQEENARIRQHELARLQSGSFQQSAGYGNILQYSGMSQSHGYGNMSQSPGYSHSQTFSHGAPTARPSLGSLLESLMAPEPSMPYELDIYGTESVGTTVSSASSVMG